MAATGSAMWRVWGLGFWVLGAGLRASKVDRERKRGRGEEGWREGERGGEMGRRK